jgi:hypothetical protein
VMWVRISPLPSFQCQKLLPSSSFWYYVIIGSIEVVLPVCLIWFFISINGSRMDCNACCLASVPYCDFVM